jgi:hypothetical protein
MDKKGDQALLNNVVYMVLVALAIVGIFAVINAQKNASGVWEEYYSKEIVKVINLARPGDLIVLDVHKATEIALDKGIGFEEIFSFGDNEACTKLGSRKSCYSYFNNVQIEKVDEKWINLQGERNVLKIKVVSGDKNE